MPTHRLSVLQSIPAIVLATFVGTWTVESQANGLPRAYESKSGKTAMEAAAKSGKPVVIYFTQENCVWCDRVENLLNRSELQSKLVDSYHFVNVDIGMANKQSWNAELTKMLSVRGTPAFAAIKASGDLLCMNYGTIQDDAELARFHESIQSLNKGAKPSILYVGGFPSCRGQESERDEQITSATPEVAAPKRRR